MTLAEQEQQAKAFVNELRKSVGQRATGRLKKGYRHNARLCPIAQSLECVGVYTASYNDEDCVVLSDKQGHIWQQEAPAVVYFMEDFDKGKYPDLTIGPTVVKVKKPGERKATVLNADH